VIWYERALYGTGVCLANTGNTKDALPLLEKLINDFPKSRFKNEAEYWLIESQLSGKPGPELEQKLKKLIANPKTSDRIKAKAHQGLAKYYDSIKQPKKALEEYVSIIVLNGDIDELQQIEGFDEISELIRVFLNAAMKIEREKYLQAGIYE